MRPSSLSVLPAPVQRCLALTVLVVIIVGGCKPNAADEFERLRKNQENATTSLQGMGAKMTRRRYPQGKAWSVDLSGIQLPNDIFNRLNALDHITDLNLSNTNVTDAQLASLKDPEFFHGPLLKLDLSNTAVTDAGLEQLDGQYTLNELNLKGTKTTPAGVQRLQQNRANNPKMPDRFKSLKIKITQ